MLKLSLNKPLFNISHPFSCKLFRVRYTPASFFANLRSPSFMLSPKLCVLLQTVEFANLMDEHTAPVSGDVN